jgi:hypothetical protein
VPRNVVTVWRRRSLLRRASRRDAQDLVLAELGRRYRVRWRSDEEGVEIDFPKRLGRRMARDRVVDDLAQIEPEWARLFAVYPSESSLREAR